MRIPAKSVVWYVADFETTGQGEYERTGRTRVWLWSIADMNAEIVADGDCIDTFMDWLLRHPSALVYFHNLKFDGSFILNWLLERGYPREEKLLVCSKRAFSTLIGDLGEFYQLKINFAPNKQVVIQDSLKIIPLKVKEIAKAFKLPIQKETIDYDDYTIDEKRLEYVHHDVRIVAMAMRFFRDQGFVRMTIGSNVYHALKDSDRSRFDFLFPRLDRDWLEEWRKAYRGGRSQVSPWHESKVLKGVRRYDINSMYPYVMAFMPMPYGEPIECDAPGRYGFELYKVRIDFTLKDGHLPTLLKRGSIFMKGDSYYLATDGVEEMYISSVDYELLKRHYDIWEVHFDQVLGFKTSRVLFREFIMKYYKLKSESEGGMRLVYKLFINNAYGKFGSKPRGCAKIPTLGEDGIAWKYSEERDMAQYYLPVAIAITSWAHKMIDDAILKTGVRNFVYCDTDSVHTLGTLPDEWVDAKEIGKFKMEAVEEESKYVRQKCYITKENGRWSITCCGMPDGVKDFLIRTYGDDLPSVFKVGLKVDADTPGVTRDDLKLMPKQVKGGTLLVPTRFSLL